MRHVFLPGIVGALLALALMAEVIAAGTSSDSSSSATQSAAFVAGQKAVKDGDWQAAIGHFTTAVNEHPQDADAYNMLAYSYRQSGDLRLAFVNYEEALRIDPGHLDAHEYIGEAYLMEDNLAKAEEHLARLDELCWLGCEQFDDLAEAVEEYRQAHASQ